MVFAREQTRAQALVQENERSCDASLSPHRLACACARARAGAAPPHRLPAVSYTHLRAHETDSYL
eukprot:6179678-Pleurochrysis_carterae.AAC.5